MSHSSLISVSNLVNTTILPSAPPGLTVPEIKRWWKEPSILFTPTCMHRYATATLPASLHSMQLCRNNWYCLITRPIKILALAVGISLNSRNALCSKVLPSEPFSSKKVVMLTVQRNYHVQLTEDHRYYSVPYQHVG